MDCRKRMFEYKGKMYFFISGAAKELGVHPNTLRLWHAKKRLVPLVHRRKLTNIGIRLYSQELLDKFLSNNK